MYIITKTNIDESSIQITSEKKPSLQNVTDCISQYFEDIRSVYAAKELLNDNYVCMNDSANTEFILEEV